MRTTLIIRYIIIALFLSAVPNSIFSQSTSGEQVIFLIRHAEKAEDGTRDPDLKEAGKLRAEKLVQVLGNYNISHIYSTNYKRTMQTATPLAKQLGLEIKTYDPSIQNVYKTILEEKGNILVVGHSNTTYRMVNAIVNESKFPPIGENEYSNLFVIVKVGDHYGAAVSKY